MIVIGVEIAVTVFKTLNYSAHKCLQDMFVPLNHIYNYNRRNSKTGLFPFHTNINSGHRSFVFQAVDCGLLKPGDYKVEQSSFTLIALF